MYTDDELKMSIAYFRNQARLALEESRKQEENADFFEKRAVELELELQFSNTPMPAGNDWYRTVPIGKLAQFKKKHYYVFCPECGGFGQERMDRLFINKKVPCHRCHGRTIVPARKITDDEMKGLSLSEQIIVRSRCQYPKKRDTLEDKIFMGV